MARSIQAQVKSTSNVTFDPFLDAWRLLNKKELQCLFPVNQFRPGSRRRPRWTTRQRLLGVSQRQLIGNRRNFLKGSNPFDFMIFPEIIGAEISKQFSEIQSSDGGKGIRIGVFHDAIAWKFPEWSARKTVDHYPEYMRSLALLDGIASVSEASRQDLIEYWDHIQLPESSRPPIKSIYLGSADTPEPGPVREMRETPIILCVATLEARKNHLSLLSAAAHLWHQGYNFKLELIGGHNRETGIEAVASVERLQESNFPVTWHGATSDADVESAYERADFVVYPSLYEGFGLPVIEALKWGKPILTTHCGSLKEVVRGGGCHVIEDTSGASIAAGITQILENPEYFKQLQIEARERTHRNWDDYAKDILGFIEDLSIQKAEVSKI
ncbi:MAG: glycosyltransferase family 4 protein [Opitutales bacterium]